MYKREPFIRTRRKEPGFPPPICDDKEADGLLKSNTSPQSQRLSSLVGAGGERGVARPHFILFMVSPVGQLCKRKKWS